MIVLYSRWDTGKTPVLNLMREQIEPEWERGPVDPFDP